MGFKKKYIVSDDNDIFVWSTSRLINGIGKPTSSKTNFSSTEQSFVNMTRTSMGLNPDLHSEKVKTGLPKCDTACTD
jgi:hypothetical protein